ncbi:DUF748 domain-containing protein [Sandaracinus amylolyticus]|uniref:DUF748 domain-containing protein n=1 Tax=Sandaracinus amylolyticus TaxID=927083 RepID=UPI001F2CCB64|nr:DUF748 domain-containing protein [Sandaracinus amylolyticus]UJR78159.1 Outer membrane protein/peptidoglycan-associated (Lipo)protein [Sandaracinus amylolyticus]
MQADTPSPELHFDARRTERARAPGHPRLRRAGRFGARLATRTGKVLLALVVLLIAARIALPYVVEHVLNERLARLEGYHGHIDDVDMALWRGAYRIEGLRIVKTGGEQPEPFFTAPVIDISVEWESLLDGKVVAEIELMRPVLNFIVAGGGAQAQTGEENDWRATVDDLVPLTINRFVVREGEVHYRDYGARPPVDLRADRMQVLARGLSNVRREREELPASVHLESRVQRSGSLTVDARLDPWQEQPTFNLSLRMRDLPARELNPMMRAYAGVDAEGGTTFLYSEIRAREGRFGGYVKPMAEGLSLFELDEEGDFFDVLGDAIVQLVAEVFENQGEDRLAIEVPVSGTFESPDVDPWAVVGSVLRNAFVEAIRHGLASPGDWTSAEEAREQRREEREQRREEARERREEAQEQAEERREEARERREERREEARERREDG